MEQATIDEEKRLRVIEDSYKEELERARADLVAERNKHVAELKPIQDELAYLKQAEFKKESERLEKERQLRKEHRGELNQLGEEVYQKLHVPFEQAKIELQQKKDLIKELDKQIEEFTKASESLEKLKQNANDTQKNAEFWKGQKELFERYYQQSYEGYQHWTAERNKAESETAAIRSAREAETRTNAARIAHDREAAQQATDIANAAYEKARKANHEAELAERRLGNVETIANKTIANAERKAAEILAAAETERRTAAAAKEAAENEIKQAQTKFQAEAIANAAKAKNDLAEFEIRREEIARKRREAIDKYQFEKLEEYNQKLAKLREEEKIIKERIKADKASGMGTSADLARMWKEKEEERQRLVTERNIISREFDAARNAIPKEIEAYLARLREQLRDSEMTKVQVDEAIVAAAREIDTVKTREQALTGMLSKWKDLSLADFVADMRRASVEQERVHMEITPQMRQKLMELYKSGQLSPEDEPMLRSLSEDYVRNRKSFTDDPKYAQFHIESLVRMEVNQTALRLAREKEDAEASGYTGVSAHEHPSARADDPTNEANYPLVDQPQQAPTPPQEPAAPPSAPAPAAPAAPTPPQQPAAPPTAPQQPQPQPQPQQFQGVPQPLGGQLQPDGSTSGAQAGATNATNIPNVVLAESIDGQPRYVGWQATIPSLPPLNPAAAGTDTAARQSAGAGGGAGGAAPGGAVGADGKPTKPDVLDATDEDKKQAQTGYQLYQQRTTPTGKQPWDTWLTQWQGNFKVMQLLQQMTGQAIQPANPAWDEGNRLWKASAQNSGAAKAFRDWYQKLSPDQQRAFDAQKGAADAPGSGTKPAAKAYSWWRPLVDERHADEIGGIAYDDADANILGGTWSPSSVTSIPAGIRIESTGVGTYRRGAGDSKDKPDARDSYLRALQVQMLDNHFKEPTGLKVPGGIFKGEGGKIGWYLGPDGTVYTPDEWAGLQDDEKGNGVSVNTQQYTVPLVQTADAKDSTPASQPRDPVTSTTTDPAANQADRDRRQREADADRAAANQGSSNNRIVVAPEHNPGKDYTPAPPRRHRQRGRGEKRKAPERPHELDENEIAHHMAAYQRKGFRGVVAADEVHTMKPYAKGGAPVSFIMNTDKRAQGGRHWVAVHWQGPNLHYYDPFGKPPTKDMKRRFTDLVAADGKHGTVQLKVNRVPNQRGNSVTCGLHSMRFLQDMHRGASFRDATNFNTKEGEAAARSLMKGADLPAFEYI